MKINNISVAPWWWTMKWFLPCQHIFKWEFFLSVMVQSWTMFTTELGITRSVLPAPACCGWILTITAHSCTLTVPLLLRLCVSFPACSHKFMPTQHGFYIFFYPPKQRVLLAYLLHFHVFICTDQGQHIKIFLYSAVTLRAFYSTASYLNTTPSHQNQLICNVSN